MRSVVIVRQVAVTDHRLGDHDPRVGVAEDAGVFFIPWRDRRRSRPAPGSSASKGRLLEHDAVRGRQALVDRCQRLRGFAVLQPQSGHDADALRLDKDLAFLAFLGANRAAEIIVGAPEPGAVPAGRPNRGFHIRDCLCVAVCLGLVAQVGRPGRSSLSPPG